MSGRFEQFVLQDPLREDPSHRAGGSSGSAEKIQEQIVVIIKVMPRDRVQPCSVEHIVDVPNPWHPGDTAQERICERIVELIVGSIVTLPRSWPNIVCFCVFSIQVLHATHCFHGHKETDRNTEFKHTNKTPDRQMRVRMM